MKSKQTAKTPTADSSGPGDDQIIIMEICEVPTLWLEALNKHNTTQIMYIKMENGISNLTKS